MVDNNNFKQVGTIFGVPLLIDLTDTVPEDRLIILDKSQLVLKDAFNAKVKQHNDHDDRLVRPCQNCGKPITPRAADVARGWGRFCSKRCKAIYQVKHS